jgi:hypothetical protein
VLGFHTKRKQLELSISGTFTEVYPSDVYPRGTVTYRTVTIGPAIFKKVDDNKWEATSPLSAAGQRDDPELAVIGCAHVEITETGSVYLTATLETRSGASVWVVDQDPERTTVTQTTKGCPRDDGTYVVPGGHGFALWFHISRSQNNGDPEVIVIPADGGTIPVHYRGIYVRAVTTAEAIITAKVIED